MRTHLKPGSPQRTRGGVSGPCEPMGRRGTGKRTVVSTGVGLGKKMGATSVGIEGTKGKQCLWSVSVVFSRLPRWRRHPRTIYSRRGTRGAPKHAFPHRTAGRHRTVQTQSMSLRTKHGRACALKECSPSLPETKGVPWMAPSAPHQPAPHAGRPEGPTGCKGQQGQIQSIQKPASQSYRTQPPARMCGVLSVGESCDWSLMPAFKQRRE